MYYWSDHMNEKIREDISVLIPHVFESMFIEIVNKTERNFIVGVIYRPHADIEIFSSNLEGIMDIVHQENKSSMIMGDANVDLLKFQTHVKSNNYIDGTFSHGFLPIISKRTTSSASLIDHMCTNLITSSYHSGIIIHDVVDNFGIFCLFHGKSKPSKPSNTKYRSFSMDNISKFKTKLDRTNFSDVLNV